MPIDTGNNQAVGLRGNRIVVLAAKIEMSADEAVLHAAWLVTMAQHNATVIFEDVLEAVQNT